MIKRIKKMFFPIIMSIICGAVCGKIVYSIYNNNTKMVLNNNRVYLIQSGEFDSYDNMRATAVGYDYSYYKDNGIYKTIIGITSNKKNIQKIIDLYDVNTTIKEYYLVDSKLNDTLLKYDSKLEKETQRTNISNLVNSMLSLYEKSKDIKLAKTS